VSQAVPAIRRIRSFEVIAVFRLEPAGGLRQAQAALVIRFRPARIPNQSPTDIVTLRGGFRPGSDQLQAGRVNFRISRRLGFKGGEHVVAEQQSREKGRDDRLGRREELEVELGIND